MAFSAYLFSETRYAACHFAQLQFSMQFAKGNWQTGGTSPITNRRIRLEVRDAYGRELKGSYTSIHEAGVTPITQEFIVTP